MQIGPSNGTVFTSGGIPSASVGYASYASYKAMPKLAPIQSASSEKGTGKRTVISSGGKEGSSDKSAVLGKVDGQSANRQGTDESRTHAAQTAQCSKYMTRNRQEDARKDSQADTNKKSLNRDVKANRREGERPQPHSHGNDKPATRGDNDVEKTGQDRSETDQSEEISTNQETSGHEAGHEEDGGHEGSKGKLQRSCKGRLYKKHMEENGKGGKPPRRETRVRIPGDPMNNNNTSGFLYSAYARLAYLPLLGPENDCCRGWRKGSAGLCLIKS